MLIESVFKNQYASQYWVYTEKMQELINGYASRSGKRFYIGKEFIRFWKDKTRLKLNIKTER